MCQSDLPDRDARPSCACVLLLLCLARALTGSMQLHASALQASRDVELGAVAPKGRCTLCLMLMEVEIKLLQVRIQSTCPKPDELAHQIANSTLPQFP